MARILYIAGYGRSGSTILGILLGQADGALNTGELFSLAKYPEVLDGIRGVESIRARLATESRRLLAEYDGAGLADAERLLAPGNASYASFWNTLFEAYESITGSRFFVDSSKTGPAAIRRPGLLQRAGHELHIIHLVRDPRAVLYSMYKRARRKGEPYPGVKTLVSWLASNLCTALMYGTGRYHYLVITYEDFCEAPDAGITRLERELPFDLAQARRALRGDEELDPGFQVDGNLLSRKGGIRFAPDNEWRQHAPRAVRWLGAAGLPLYWLLRLRSVLSGRRARARGGGTST